MTNDHNSDDLRGLFDWRNAAARVEQLDETSASVENDDLALALQLLSCNGRDRQQFGGTNTNPTAHA